MTKRALAAIIMVGIGISMPGGVAARSGTANAPAELMMVEKDVFTLKVGKSMDLTDRGILLHVSRINADNDGKAESVVFTYNGAGGRNYQPGHRLD